MRASSLRNINVSETVYSGAGEDGELFSRPNIDEEFVDEIKMIVNCDEDKKESFYLILLLFGLVGYGFNFLFSLYALYETDYITVSRNCPESLLWYYLLSSTIVLNFIYYMCFKGFNLIDNGKIIKYFFSFIFISSSLFGVFGYLVTNDTCVITNFKDTKLWEISHYNNYGQMSIAVLSITTPIYLFYQNQKKITDKTTESKSDTPATPKKENIKVEIIEN